ncbi:hypothetical protein, partial [Duganella callida]|uniref:hypothetical protein n=1 Tax=Duganella callida TaxID=2561932 RepID=UPI00197AC648
TTAALAAAAAGGGEEAAQPDKKIKRLFWSYGEEQTPVAGVSRFYVDLNLHVETENYGAGETVDVEIANGDVEEIAAGLKTLKLTATVDASGSAVIKNVFSGKTVDISSSA